MTLLLTSANGFVGRHAQAAMNCVPLEEGDETGGVARLRDPSLRSASRGTGAGAALGLCDDSVQIQLRFLKDLEKREPNKN